MRVKANAPRYVAETGNNWDPNLLFNVTKAAEETISGIPIYYIHMSNSPKVGVNLNPSYGNTPLGVYGFPLNSDYLNKLLYAVLPYRSEALFTSILELRQPEHTLTSSTEYSYLMESLRHKDIIWMAGLPWISGYPPGFEEWHVDDKEELWADWGGPHTTKSSWINHPRKEALTDLLVMSAKRYGMDVRFDAAIDEWDTIPDSVFGKLVDIAMKKPIWIRMATGDMLSVFEVWEELGSPTMFNFDQFLEFEQKQVLEYQRGPLRCNLPAGSDLRRSRFMRHILLREGYTSVYDPGEGFIHPNEPTQIVFLTPKSYRVVAQFDTKELRKEIRRQNYHAKASMENPAPKAVQFSLYDLTLEQKTDLYEVFKASYINATGSAWSSSLFNSRTANWTFYGIIDGARTGVVAIRTQRSGLNKLVAIAGHPRSALAGIHLLMTDKQNEPLWGMVSADLVPMSKRMGLMTAHDQAGGPTFMRAVLSMVPAEVFGDSQIKVLPDGGISVNVAEVGTVTKYLVFNQAYLQALVKQAVFMLPAAVPMIQMFTTRLMFGEK